jgi:hypothetical protein
MKATGKRKATSQTVENLLEGQVRPPPPPPTLSGPSESNTSPPNDRFDNNDESTDAKFSLHPDDPAHFLKLSAALRIIIKHQLSNDDLDRVDILLRDYATELIRVRDI